MLSFEKLERIYTNFNKRCFVHPDPLEFLYNYNLERDIEIVGMISSSLAYGNVKQILKSVSAVLSILAPSPFEYLTDSSQNRFISDFKGFKHRFTTAEDKVNLLFGVKGIIKEYGSINECFSDCYKKSNKHFLDSVTLLTERVNKYSPEKRSYLVPSPKKGSACKRLMLYLRWMLRKDEVDPGCWHDLNLSSELIMPIDTHIFQISRMNKLTARNSANLKTAIEITEKFKSVLPHDPVKYDFALSRFGIRNELTYDDIHK